MARNVEKSQNVLNRLINAKSAEARPGGSNKPAKRPFLASECDDLADADRWRAQVVREIGSKVMEIQNAGLGEARLRDLNDEINKLLRVKWHWERQIVELGGPDYSKAAPAAGGAAPEAAAAAGISASSSASARGAYRYFGAAKLFPGVKELFEAPPVRGGGGGGGAGAGRGPAKRPQLAPGSGGDYFGFRDEDEDPELLKEEAAADAARDARLLAEWEREHGGGGGEGGSGAAARRGGAARRDGSHSDGDDDDDVGLGGGQGRAHDATADLSLPDRAELEAALVARKKAALLAKYG